MKSNILVHSSSCPIRPSACILCDAKTRLIFKSHQVESDNSVIFLFTSNDKFKWFIFLLLNFETGTGLKWYLHKLFAPHLVVTFSWDVSTFFYPLLTCILLCHPKSLKKRSQGRNYCNVIVCYIHNSWIKWY